MHFLKNVDLFVSILAPAMLMMRTISSDVSNMNSSTIHKILFAMMASLTPFETGPAMDMEINSRNNAVTVQTATMAWNLFGSWQKN